MLAAELIESIEWSLMFPPGSACMWTLLVALEDIIPCVYAKTNSNVPWIKETIAKAIKKRRIIPHCQPHMHANYLITKNTNYKGTKLCLCSKCLLLCIRLCHLQTL